VRHEIDGNPHAHTHTHSRRARVHSKECAYRLLRRIQPPPPPCGQVVAFVQDGGRHHVLFVFASSATTARRGGRRRMAHVQTFVSSSPFKASLAAEALTDNLTDECGKAGWPRFYVSVLRVEGRKRRCLRWLLLHEFVDKQTREGMNEFFSQSVYHSYSFLPSAREAVVIRLLSRAAAPRRLRPWPRPE